MIGRFLFWPSRLALILFGIVAFALAVYASAAQAQQICAVDLNGNGDADDAGETASCVGMQGGSWQCPIERASCAPEPGGASSCPLGSQYACETLARGRVPRRPPNACIDPAANPIADEHVVADPGPPPDGKVATQGTCTGP